MKKAIFISLIVLISCKSSKEFEPKVTDQDRVQFYLDALNYVENDSIFIKKIKQRYNDIDGCNIKFVPNNFVKPIELEDFGVLILSKTKPFKKTEELSSLNQKERIQKFDSIYGFQKFNLGLNYDYFDFKNDCYIILTFSKPIDNYLPVKFEINDKNVDSKIEYKPRKGLYYLEFNEKRFVDSHYIMMSQ